MGLQAQSAEHPLPTQAVAVVVFTSQERLGLAALVAVETV